MATFPGVYPAMAKQVNGSSVDVYVPQVFGDLQIRVTSYVRSLPTASEMGWVTFQGGNPEFPVWIGSGVVGGGGTGDGDGGVAVVDDEVWISPSEPFDPTVELWYDTDEELPVVPLIAVKGTYFGTATPLPVNPVINDMWVIGTPVPTAAPARGDGTGAAQVGDAIVWNGTAWQNVGAFRGPPGAAGAAGATGPVAVPAELLAVNTAAVAPATGDATKLVSLTYTGGPVVITLGTAMVAPYEVHYMRDTTQTATFAAGAGATVSSAAAKLAIANRYSVVTAKKLTATQWVIFGDLA